MSLSTTATSTATKLSAFIASKVSSPASRKAKMDAATGNTSTTSSSFSIMRQMIHTMSI